MNGILAVIRNSKCIQVIEIIAILKSAADYQGLTMRPEGRCTRQEEEGIFRSKPLKELPVAFRRKEDNPRLSGIEPTRSWTLSWEWA